MTTYTCLTIRYRFVMRDLFCCPLHRLRRLLPINVAAQVQWPLGLICVTPKGDQSISTKTSLSLCLLFKPKVPKPTHKQIKSWDSDCSSSTNCMKIAGQVETGALMWMCAKFCWESQMKLQTMSQSLVQPMPMASRAGQRQGCSGPIHQHLWKG